MGTFCDCGPRSIPQVHSKTKIKRHYQVNWENCTDASSYSTYSLLNDSFPKLQHTEFIIKKKHKISIDDFEIIELIGKGSFGVVYLVKKKSSNKYYAMKKLEKSKIKDQKQKNHTKTERKILETFKHPFIVHLYYAFQNDTDLFLITQFVEGGELFQYLRKEGAFSEERARFYIIEVIIALHYLHEQNCIYRDLKPENILLDKTGHIKLTDFGLSKILIDKEQKAYTICGTPAYLAPEILTEEGYDQAVDWWSLGVVLYELLSGNTPFDFSVYPKISVDVYKSPILLHSYFSKNARDLIKKLLNFTPSKRIRFKEIIKHPFFKGVNWDDYLNLKIVPPFIPSIKNEKDRTLLKQIQTDLSLEDKDDSEDYLKEEYPGFSYNCEIATKSIHGN